MRAARRVAVAVGVACAAVAVAGGDDGPEIDCGIDRFDRARFQSDVRTLEGQIERVGRLSRLQWQARVALACERLEDRPREEVRALLGPPSGESDDGREWVYALGPRPDGEGSEMLELIFDATGRSESAQIVEGGGD